jgi:ketosteroid isomerase-like protein
MSENLDLVRSIYAARVRGDWRTEVEWLHPDIEVVSVGGPDPREVSGLRAVAGAWREFLRAWENFRVDLQEIRVLDEERVLVLFRRSGRGKVSGMEIKDLAGSEGADVFLIRDGRVVRLDTYWDRDRALADLRLEG